MTRETEKIKFYRRQIERLELDLDKCQNVYGVVPCTAAGAVGSECYNTFTSCQDQSNYARGTATLSFCHRGGTFEPGEDVRPYMTAINSAATEIVRDKGLAVRGRAAITLSDEEVADVLDPYRATRATPAGSTYWHRLLARTPNYYGRVARLRRGFATEPFSLDAVRDEEYIIDNIQGPDAANRVQITLSDRTKLLDTTMVPTVTTGKLTAALPAFSAIVPLVSAGDYNAQLSEDASPVDGAYVGQEIHVIQGDGTGQRRVITSYTGATRLAVISVAWAANPTNNSSIEVSPLSLTINDAANYAAAGWVRIGDEVIKYTSVIGNTLYWPDGTYRQQFGTERIDHSVRAKVQQCRVFESATPLTVIQALLNDAGILDANIDLAGIGTTLTDWAAGGSVTVCIAAPEKASALLSDLCQDFNLSLWWDSVAALVKGKVNAPEQVYSLVTLTDNEFLQDKTKVTRQDEMRITEAATDYNLRSPVVSQKEASSYIFGDSAVDGDAESANEFGDVRQELRQTRWMNDENQSLVRAVVKRKLIRRRNVPYKFAFNLDYSDEVLMGQLVYITTRYLVGFDGQPKQVLARITKIDDMGTHQSVEALSTGFREDVRYGFIAPAGLGNYTAVTQEQRDRYAFAGDAVTNEMSNNDDGYIIS
jgi:hypothetical protein